VPERQVLPIAECEQELDQELGRDPQAADVLARCGIAHRIALDRCAWNEAGPSDSASSGPWGLTAGSNCRIELIWHRPWCSWPTLGRPMAHTSLMPAMSGRSDRQE